jgi:hypothetical protein
MLSEVSVSLEVSLEKTYLDTPGMYQKITFAYSRNSLIPSAHYNIIHKRLELLMDTIARLYPRPVNAMVHSSGSIDEGNTYPLVGTEFRSSPYQSELRISFHDIIGWNDDDPVPQGETGYGIKLQFNSIWFILQRKPVQYGNNMVFRAPVKGTDVEQYQRYNGLIVMSYPGKNLPWRPATRQEYLENAIANLNFNKHLKEGSYEYKYSSIAKKLLSEMTDAERLVPAYLERKDKRVVEYFMSDWKGFRKAGDADAEALVIADEKYFDDKRPKTSIQLIAIGANSISDGEKRKVEIRKLNAMLLAPGVLGSINAMLYQ